MRQEEMLVFGIVRPVERRLKVRIMGLHLFRINSYNNALAAEAHRCCLDEFRVVNGGRIDRNFVAAREQEVADVIKVLDATSDRQRHEDLLCSPANDIEDNASLFVGGGDVQEREFICSLFVVCLRDFDGIAGVAKIHEAHAFHNTAGFYIQAGDDSFG